MDKLIGIFRGYFTSNSVSFASSLFAHPVGDCEQPRAPRLIFERVPADVTRPQQSSEAASAESGFKWSQIVQVFFIRPLLQN
jgi:hypothetical protein